MEAEQGASQNQDEVPEYAEILRRVADSPRNYPIPRKVSRAHLEQAFLTSFELIGGVPRLALWADQNPDKFYALLSKLFPQKMEAKVGVDESLAKILMSMGRAPRLEAPKDVQGTTLTELDGATVTVVADGQTNNVHAGEKA